MTAEALGLRAGLALALRVVGHPGRIEVVGDNLLILRMAVGNGKVWKPQIWQILEQPLLHTAVQGWDCEWIAVRRTYNTAADRLATIGTLSAVEAAVAQANTEPTLRIWERQSVAGQALDLPWHSGWQADRSDVPFFTAPDQPGGSNQAES